MKKSIIRQIFNGERGHIESLHFKEEYSKYAGKVSDIYDKLVVKLSPEVLKMHEQFIDALEDNQDEAIDFYFVEGFKLGLLIGIECSED